MDIWEADKLALFIAFIIPGFVSIKAYQLIIPGSQRGMSEQLIDVVAYSCVNYALLIIPISLVESGLLQEKSKVGYFLFYVIVLFVMPIIWVLIWKYLRTREFFQRNAPHPVAKPWDYVFGQRKPYWVKIILKDGTIVAGRYAENSFASSAPAAEQIFLEKTWILNEKGAFMREKNNSAGVIVLSSEISHIEFRS